MKKDYLQQSLRLCAATLLTATAITFAPVFGAASTGIAYAQEASDAALAEQRLNTWYSQAIDSINNKDYENALLCLNGCLVYCTQQNNPTLYADLYMKKGYCSLMLKKYEDAGDALDEALKVDPEMENALLLKASVYSETGALSEAVEALQKYIDVSQDTDVYETLSALYEAQGESEKAFEAYSAFADAVAESKADAAYMCGVYLMQRGDYESAITSFNEAIEDEAPADGAYYNRGICYMSMGDYEKAIADLGSSVEKEESQAADALYSKATCEMTILSYEDAVADFTACVDQEIKKQDSMINRGICLLLSGSSQEALKDFDESIEEGTNADEARFYRSFVYLAQKEYENALADLTQCIDNGYDVAGSYLQRAQVYKEMGNEEAYAADLEASQKAQQEAQEPEEAVTESAEEAMTE